MENVLTAVAPKLLAQGLLALRQECTMPQLVNRSYEALAAQRGDTVNVPIPSDVEVTDVVPGPYASNSSALTPSVVQIQLSEWKEAAFTLTDKDVMQSMSGIIPMQASSAIGAIAEYVNAYIMSKYVSIYGFAGTPGTTPFGTPGDLSDATTVRAILNLNKCPIKDRRFILDPNAEANALNQRAFQDYSFSGGAGAIVTGKIGEKLGFGWAMDQQIPLHKRGTANNAYTTDNTGYAVGAKQITIITGTGTILKGDIFTIAGDPQTYVCTENLSGPGILKFSPGLKVAIPAVATAITFKGMPGMSYPQNLAFHRDCFAFASRPLQDSNQVGGAIMVAASDPVSGLTLRLEITRQNKQTRYAFDMLFGAECVRPELGVRLWG